MRTSKLQGVIAAIVLVSACGDDPSDAATWQVLAEKRPSALLAAWAGGADDAWIVGGRLGVGMAPAVYHYDGAQWSALDAGVTNVDLWQVFGFADGTAFFGGSNGTLLRYRSGTFEKLATPSMDTIFGLWGSSPNDVWAVGGATAGRAFVWRYRGTQFEPVAGIPASLATGTVWKVTGRSADDVWMSCSQGLVLHWDGQNLTSETIGGTEESLFSIGCNGARCVTAGTNITNGVLYQNDGAGWTSRVPTTDGPVWRGVTPTSAQPYVVGQFGAVLRLDGDTWIPETHGKTTESFHAVWSDAAGLFAVGGKFDRLPTIDGVLLYKGAATMPPLP